MTPMSQRLPILVINPNTTQSMTEGMRAMMEPYNISPPPTYWTAPSTEGGIPSINSSADCHASAEHVLPLILSSNLLSKHSAILIACYSIHPLVSELKKHTARPVTGIFEASVSASLLLLNQAARERFGIVSTGKVWEETLSAGVENLLGAQGGNFAGVETTGLTAVELHTTPASVVAESMKEAVKRLLRREQGKVRVICLGCAGMAGMEELVREASVEELGAEEGERVKIVDGVKVGVAILQGLVQVGF